jgi:hypothetical protein
MRIALAALAVLAATAPAFAGPPSLTPLSDPEEPPAQRIAPLSQPSDPSRPQADTARLSEDTATMLAVGSTLGGVAAFAAGVRFNSAPLGWLGVAGVFVGPSAGHIYAGERLHAVGMTALRGAGAMVFLYGVIKATVVYENAEPGFGGGTSTSDDHRDAVPLMVLGASAFIGGTVYDLIDAHRAARRANHEATIAVAPLATQHTVGLALAGSF